MMSHFSGHTSKIDVIYLLWKPKLPQPLIQEPSIRKKKFCKSIVITKTLNAFFPIGIENFNSKAKKSSLVILTKKKIF